MLEKLFPKKVRDKDVQRFWKEFCERAELYLAILTEDAEDSEDRAWVETLVRKGLNRVCIDADASFGFEFESERDPIRLIFYYNGDDFLKKAGDKLASLYPKELAGKIDFLVAE